LSLWCRVILSDTCSKTEQKSDRKRRSAVFEKSSDCVSGLKKTADLRKGKKKWRLILTKANARVVEDVPEPVLWGL